MRNQKSSLSREGSRVREKTIMEMSVVIEIFLKDDKFFLSFGIVCIRSFIPINDIGANKQRGINISPNNLFSQ
jgi:hypothetical protein